MRHLQLEPARAKSVKPEKIPWGDAEYLAEEKLDGWRELMHVGANLDRVYMTGRRTSDVTGELSEKALCVPCLWPDWRRIHPQLGYTVLDGEVMPPVGRTFADMAGILNVDPADALARIAEIGEPLYYAFDVLFYNGADVRELAYLERRQMLTSVIRDLGHPLWRLPTEHLNTREAFARVVETGGEGLILKDVSGGYGESSAWIKVKRSHTLDVVVTGYEAGRGKYTGQIGAVLVSVYSTSGALMEVGAVSGMTDAVRLDISENRGAWLGRVVEIEAQEFAKERLRHPRWKRPREDVDSRTCTVAKMMRDLGATTTPAPTTVSASSKQGSLF